MTALNKRPRVNSALYAILSGVRFAHTHHLICVIAIKTVRARARDPPVHASSPLLRPPASCFIVSPYVFTELNDDELSVSKFFLTQTLDQPRVGNRQRPEDDPHLNSRNDSESER